MRKRKKVISNKPTASNAPNNNLVLIAVVVSLFLIGSVFLFNSKIDKVLTNSKTASLNEISTPSPNPTPIPPTITRNPNIESSKKTVPVLFMNKTINCLPEGVTYVQNVVSEYNRRMDGNMADYKSCLDKCSNSYSKFLDDCSSINNDVDSCVSSGKPTFEKCGLECKNTASENSKKILDNTKSAVPTISKYCTTS